MASRAFRASGSGSTSTSNYDELVELVRKGFHWDNLIRFCSILSEDGPGQQRYVCVCICFDPSLFSRLFSLVRLNLRKSSGHSLPSYFRSIQDAFEAIQDGMLSRDSQVSGAQSTLTLFFSLISF